MLSVGQILEDKDGSRYKVLAVNHGFNNQWLGLKKCGYDLEIVFYPRRPEMVGHTITCVSQDSISETCGINIEDL